MKKEKMMYWKSFIEGRIATEERKENKKFIKENKWYILAFDLMIIFAILSNMGAVFVTNMLVEKNAPEDAGELVFYEANPVVAETNNLQVHKDSKPVFTGLLLHVFVYLMLLMFYIISRVNCHKKKHLIKMAFLALTVFSVWGFDFFNDFGFLVGKILWGG